jgi:membrane protein required for colicin V production
MNSFDAAVVAVTAVLALLGFRAGLMRSVADILGFIIATPLSIALMERMSSGSVAASQPWGQNSLVFFGVLVVSGVLIAQILRFAIGDVLGHDIHLVDRFAGFVLGALRALLVAVVVVLVFDRIIPQGRDPEFLKTSKLRPMLSVAAQRGLRSLPPEITDYIDRLKKERGL